MRAKQILKLAEGTADPAFAINDAGLISAWNNAAAELFGLTPAEALGVPCHQIMQGHDESGLICSEHCAIHQAMKENRPLVNFDLQLQTKSGTQWCNVSVLIASEPGSASPHAVHIVHPREMRKRLEQVVRDFVVTQTGIESSLAERIVSSGRTVASNIKLTARQAEILRLLCRGTSTNGIANELCISRATVNNHVRSILTKLDAHTRLEAVHRARRAGLI